MPRDVVVAKEITTNSPNENKNIEDISSGDIICDLGLDSLINICNMLNNYGTVIWNGPIGVFETRPFDFGTICIAKKIALLTSQGKINSVGGGGDIVCALNQASVQHNFSYLSTAGGAFLKWLANQDLVGVSVLYR